MNFRGTYVAMVTPLTSKFEIDEEGFRKNINYLIDNGVDGLLAVGTTGESATVTHDEHKFLIDTLIDEVDGRVQTLAGAGSNSTEEAIDYTKYAEDAGADAALVITPYYNKPQQHGLIEHYRTISDNSDIPIIAYNVPSRTGLDIASETVVELAKIDSVDALKEASPSIDKFSSTCRLLQEADLFDDFTLLSGDDGLTLAMMTLGASGVISASANVDSARMVLMANCILDGDYDKAQEIHYEMHNLIKALFIESNPVPAKTALNMMGLPAGPVRQPLAPMLDKNVEILKKALIEANYLNE